MDSTTALASKATTVTQTILPSQLAPGKVYEINRWIGGSSPVPFYDFVSHTFIVTTDGNGNILHTYSWGNTANTHGWNIDQPEDIEAATAALRLGWLYVDQIDGVLPSEIAEAFKMRLPVEHPNWGFTNNCKWEANFLIQVARILANGERGVPFPLSD